ncbi:MAG: hypothetical protein HRU19_17730 [Pseudobacteriovorax sp.]|nr:hypothetical protein [Pseudobacteriovorax sp.]
MGCSTTKEKVVAPPKKIYPTVEKRDSITLPKPKASRIDTKVIDSDPHLVSYRGHWLVQAGAYQYIIKGRSLSLKKTKLTRILLALYKTIDGTWVQKKGTLALERFEFASIQAFSETRAAGLRFLGSQDDDNQTTHLTLKVYEDVPGLFLIGNDLVKVVFEPHSELSSYAFVPKTQVAGKFKALSFANSLGHQLTWMLAQETCTKETPSLQSWTVCISKIFKNQDTLINIHPKNISKGVQIGVFDEEQGELLAKTGIYEPFIELPQIDKRKLSLRIIHPINGNTLYRTPVVAGQQKMIDLSPMLHRVEMQMDRIKVISSEGSFFWLEKDSYLPEGDYPVGPKNPSEGACMLRVRPSLNGKVEKTCTPITPVKQRTRKFEYVFHDEIHGFKILVQANSALHHLNSQWSDYLTGRNRPRGILFSEFVRQQFSKADILLDCPFNHATNDEILWLASVIHPDGYRFLNCGPETRTRRLLRATDYLASLDVPIELVNYPHAESESRYYEKTEIRNLSNQDDTIIFHKLSRDLGVSYKRTKHQIQIAVGGQKTCNQSNPCHIEVFSPSGSTASISLERQTERAQLLSFSLPPSSDWFRFEILAKGKGGQRLLGTSNHIKTKK